MRRLIVGVGVCLICCSQLAASAYAADVPAKTAVAVVNPRQAQSVKPNATVATSKAIDSKGIDSDSRLNGYRLEREGCCGLQ